MLQAAQKIEYEHWTHAGLGLNSMIGSCIYKAPTNAGKMQY
jgi:hypothetical protein